jgi:hypothetical protein
MRRLVAAGSAIVVIAAVWWLWPTETRRVRTRVIALAHAVSVPAGEPDLQRVARMAALARGLAADVSLEGPEDGRAITGREAVVGLASRLGSLAGPASIELSGVNVAVDDLGSSAAVTATVHLRTSEHPDVQRLESEAVRIELTKVAGEWLVTRVAAERALTKPALR